MHTVDMSLACLNVLYPVCSWHECNNRIEYLTVGLILIGVGRYTNPPCEYLKLNLVRILKLAVIVASNFRLATSLAPWYIGVQVKRPSNSRVFVENVVLSSV